MPHKHCRSFVSLAIIFSFFTDAVAQYDSIFVDNRFRTFLTHIPSDYSGIQKWPLVIALHGGTGNAFNLQNQSQLSSTANDEHFLVVYPEGLKGGLFNIRTWNAGVCCGHASQQNIDDVAYIDTLLDYLLDLYAIDERRVYVTGMSNGGYMAYRLACEMGSRLAAIAPVACSMTLDNCENSSAVPIIHFHSFLDENVRYQGGYGVGLSTHYSPPVDSILNVWSEINNCQVTNDTLIANSEFTHVQWQSCSCERIIDYYISEDGGHSWPGGNATLFGEPPSEFIDANDLMWSFFTSYTNECDSTTSDFYLENDAITILPNPMNELLEINGLINMYSISILDQQGQLLHHIKPTGSHIRIDTSFLTQGLYFIAIQHESVSKLFLQKIVKM